MRYQIQKMATFIKFTRMEHAIGQRQFAKLIYVSHGMVGNIENGKLLSLDQHLDNIFNCFHLDITQYTDQDEEWCKKVHQIIHQTIYYELPFDNEEILKNIYFEGIENTYLFLYYQLIKTCLYARQYTNDLWLKKYIPIFDIIIHQFDDIIQQYYFIIKYGYYKEKRMFDVCNSYEEVMKSPAITDDMKGFYYYACALRYMYEGDTTLEFQYMNLAKEYCEQSNNERRLIALTTIECDIYEKLGDMGKVIELFEGAIKQMEVLHFDNLKYIFLSNLGIAYYHVKDYKKTIKCLDKSIKKNKDNLDMFYLVDSYIKTDNKKKAWDLLENRYRVRSFSDVFYDLLDWCHQTLKRPYTKKCEYILKMIYKKHYQEVSLNTKKLILNLLIEHFEYKDNYFLMSQYQKELINIVKGEKT